MQRTNKDFGCWVVDVYGLEDGGAVVGNTHLLAAAQALQNLVLWWMERGVDVVTPHTSRCNLPCPWGRVLS